MNPTYTLCVVSIGDDEDKVTTATDEVITLPWERNLFDSNEVVVHGIVGETEEPTQDSLAITEIANTIKDSQSTGIINSGTKNATSIKRRSNQEM